MKQKFLFQLLVMLMLILSAIALSLHAARDYHDQNGIEAPISAAKHMIVMLPDTKFMNVQDGAIVIFGASGKSFTWLFNGPPHLGSFDLNVVILPTFLTIRFGRTSPWIHADRMGSQLIRLRG